LFQRIVVIQREKIYRVDVLYPIKHCCDQGENEAEHNYGSLTRLTAQKSLQQQTGYIKLENCSGKDLYYFCSTKMGERIVVNYDGHSVETIYAVPAANHAVVRALDNSTTVLSSPSHLFLSIAWWSETDRLLYFIERDKMVPNGYDIAVQQKHVLTPVACLRPVEQY